mmetsp:Transcript_25935/g.24780  ORF Transcript_25935/g.24780 Transcript_25935/m.24780 type:complete len:265 (-) Transcript_25935:127-921(-)|eukprot:CAMPEP_0119047610 /NCGR_PEP_ID=MMETSP1177-20130426/54153_1 /TAXON_ID=2985 /ORGANISM="Ochromonas sp, Strain CCMP1899" /LENGTH=264 /DNA_ID=CAMNT_0007022413 /DNA_START=822 /DNA_END=1616 /DNA_ORIENTATION=+
MANSKESVNIKLSDGIDRGGYATMITTRKIVKGEELFIKKYLHPEGNCSICANDLNDDEKYNIIGCKCIGNNIKYLDCITTQYNSSENTLGIKYLIDNKTRGPIGEIGTCDQCKGEIAPAVIAKLKLSRVQDKDHRADAEQAAKNAIPMIASRSSGSSRSSSGSNCGSKSSSSRSKKEGAWAQGIAWMDDDNNWADIDIWGYMSAVDRNAKAAENNKNVNGPVRKKGQFKYKFRESTGVGKRKMRVVEDYFSEGDETILLFKDN